jgi:hypothetical protein
VGGMIVPGYLGKNGVPKKDILSRFTIVEIPLD